MGRRLAAVGAVAVLAVGGAAAARDDHDGPTDRERSRAAADRTCAPAPAGHEPVTVAAGAFAARVVAEVDEPTATAFLADGSGDGFLAERDGRVLRVAAGAVTDDVALDLTDDTMQEGDGGLLALALGPGDEWLYTYRADAARDDVVVAYPVRADGGLDADAARTILAVDHPDSLQHHGGSLAVGLDGTLYVGFGDGGGLGDPRENAQDLTVPLGKVLRVEPTPDGPEPYRIPADNPFVGESGAAPEIWALGVRNPFRMSLDAPTGDLWLGDVGQTCWEELDRLPTGAASAGGANLGWDVVEGRHRFEGEVVPGRRVDPVQEEPHDDGWCGIVAGYVVRGDAVPALDGRLLYTDYCRGRVLALRADPGAGGPRLVDTRLRIDAPIAIVPGPLGRPWILTLRGQVLEVEAR